jgi:hypothetical protein
VLTGASNAKPKVTDTVSGKTSESAAFRFHSDDDSVEALGAAPDDKQTGGRVRTEIPVAEERKGGKVKY